MKFPFFRIDESEFSKQVAGHDTLPVWKTSRGIAVQSILVLLTVGVLTLATLTYFNLVQGLSVADVVLSLVIYAPLLYFTFRGSALATVLLIAYYTLDKIATPLVLGLAPNLISLVFWAIGTGPLWVAFQVERAYEKSKKAPTAQ